MTAARLRGLCSRCRRHLFVFRSDAFGLSELYFLGAKLFRRSLKNVLNRWLAEDACSLKDAEEIIRMVAHENARRIYPLN